MKIRLSFQGWILGGFVLVVLCTLAFLVVFLQSALRDQMVGQIRQDLHHQLVLLQEVISDRWDPEDSLEVTDSLADHLGGRVGLRVTLIARDGLVLGDSEVPTDSLSELENHANRPEVIQALDTGEGWSLRYSTTLGVDLLYAARLMGNRVNPQLILRIAIPLNEVKQTLSRLKQLILLGTLLGVILSVFLAYLASRYISRPVKNLTRTAQRITSGDVSPRLKRYAKNEIGDLSRAFDQMADHLQEEIRAVTEARDRLEVILRGMEEGVILVDRDGHVVLANRALRELLNMEVDPAGRSPTEIFRNADLQEAIQQVLEGTAHISLEVRTLSANQRVLEVHVVGLSDEGAQGGAVAVFHDITERKRIEEVRRDFVANVSHELRTPLTAIRGAIETLLDGALDNPQYARHFAEVIQRHLSRLQGLLDDLLDLAKIESRETKPNVEDIQAAELVDAVLSSVAEVASARGVELLRELPREPVLLRGDRHQVEQALVNLLENGIKYTEPGGQVTLGLRQKGDEIHLFVSDTGIGIGQEHLPRIFERFYRVDKARSRELGGTGLGLAIVKHIAQAHGGRVEVESTLGRGSTFRFILPA